MTTLLRSRGPQRERARAARRGYPAPPLDPSRYDLKDATRECDDRAIDKMEYANFVERWKARISFDAWDELTRDAINLIEVPA